MRKIAIMPDYLTYWPIYAVIWPLPIAAIVIAVVVSLVVRNIEKKEPGYFRSLTIVLSCFSLLGVTIGFLSGLSRESVLGDVLPAILGIIGAISVFLLEKKAADRVFICGLVTTLSLDLLLASMWGATAREGLSIGPFATIPAPGPPRLAPLW